MSTSLPKKIEFNEDGIFIDGEALESICLLEDIKVRLIDDGNRLTKPDEPVPPLFAVYLPLLIEGEIVLGRDDISVTVSQDFDEGDFVTRQK